MVQNGTNYWIDINDSIEDKYVLIDCKIEIDVEDFIDKIFRSSGKYNTYACNLDTLHEIVKETKKNWALCCHEQNSGKCLGNCCTHYKK